MALLIYYFPKEFTSSPKGSKGMSTNDDEQEDWCDELIALKAYIARGCLDAWDEAACTKWRSALQSQQSASYPARNEILR